MKDILVLHGPNLNFLGIREPAIYGRETLEDLENLLKKAGEERDCHLHFFQSNHEGDLIDRLQAAYGSSDGILINPGALTHYSYALLDALTSVQIPYVEVHISAIEERESFRRHSVTAAGAKALVSGKGFPGYIEALDILLNE